MWRPSFSSKHTLNTYAQGVYLVIFFFRVFEYFTFTVAASIMVGENQALLGGNRPPYTGCCQTFPLTTGQKATISWT